MAKLRILLADDHAVIREGLKTLVNSSPDMEVVGEAESGRATLQKTAELSPDVVVIDISMPELNGLKVTEVLRRDHPGVKVLILTVHEDMSYLRQVLKLGASGYVLKRALVEELVHAIRTVAAGDTYLDPVMAGKIVGGYVRREVEKDELRRGELSSREEDVLRLIAWGHANKEIAAKLNISVKTVETYKARLMEKLGLHSRVELVRYALEQGWLKTS